jgi:hypothetical protein
MDRYTPLIEAFRTSLFYSKNWHTIEKIKKICPSLDDQTLQILRENLIFIKALKTDGSQKAWKYKLVNCDSKNLGAKDHISPGEILEYFRSLSVENMLDNASLDKLFVLYRHSLPAVTLLDIWQRFEEKVDPLQLRRCVEKLLIDGLIIEDQLNCVRYFIPSVELRANNLLSGIVEEKWKAIPRSGKRIQKIELKSNQVIEEYDSLTEAAIINGLLPSNISSAVQRDGTCGGFKWKYLPKSA